MRLFKRNQTLKPHLLRRVGMLNQKDFYRAVRCETCSREYIMDVFGGWAIEWKFKMMDEWTVEPDDLSAAVQTIHKTPSTEWFQVDQQPCHIQCG